MKRPSTITIAQQAGVSTATVSYVLNGKFQDRIPVATRNRVKEVAEQLGYRPNHLARSLLTGKSRTIGLLVPSFNFAFYQSLVDGIDEVLHAQGYKLLCCHNNNTDDREGHLVEFFMEHRTDGILCIATCYSILQMQGWLSRIDARSYPMVIIDDSSHAELVDSVVSDDVTGMQRATEYLISLGHQRIAHLSSGWINSTGRDRMIGYRQALAAHGIAYNNLIDVSVRGDIPGAYTSAIKSFLSMAQPPTAVVLDASSMIEEYYSECFLDRSMDPFALSVVGYDDSNTARMFNMTAISQNPVEIGARAAQRLLDRMHTPDLPPALIKIQPELIVRSSCRPLAED